MASTMKQPVIEIKPDYKSLFLAYLFLMSLSLILQLSGGTSWASLSIVDINHGQLWRIITSHLTHYDWHHFAMNMIGMALCILVFRDDLPSRHWLLSFLFISIFSSLGLLSIYDEYQRYAGFSDVLHGWILMGALAISPREPKLALAIFVLFWLKILEENSGLQFFTSATMDSGSIATNSHIFGAIGGILYALISLTTVRRFLFAKFSRKAIV